MLLANEILLPKELSGWVVSAFHMNTAKCARNWKKKLQNSLTIISLYDNRTVGVKDYSQNSEFQKGNIGMRICNNTCSFKFDFFLFVVYFVLLLGHKIPLKGYVVASFNLGIFPGDKSYPQRIYTRFNFTNFCVQSHNRSSGKAHYCVFFFIYNCHIKIICNSTFYLWVSPHLIKVLNI